MTTYYLAGRFDRKAEIARYADDLRTIGSTVNARWLTGAHDHTTEGCLTGDQLIQYASEDLEDIDAADALVLFLEHPNAGYLSGGRHVETGYAIARGKAIYLVGFAKENVFHALYPRFATWDAFMASRLLEVPA